MRLIENEKNRIASKVSGNIYRKGDISLLTIRTTLLTRLYNEINR